MAVKERDIRFDILKFIGILCIILAHTTSRDSLVFELRNFDVPLMVVASGSLFYISAKNSNSNYGYRKYLTKRLFRLVAPTWFFLSAFFLLTYLTSWIFEIDYHYSLEKIVKAYLFLNFDYYDVWYTWILRIFVLIAIIAPFILVIWNKLQSKVLFFSLISCVYLGYELCFKVIGYRTSLNILKHYDYQPIIPQIIMFTYDVIVNQIFFYILPYGCLFAIGVLAINLNRKDIIKISLLSLSIFLSLVIFQVQTLDYQNLLFLQEYKYPPRLYYLSYSIFVWSILYLIVTELVKVQNFKRLLSKESRIYKLLSYSSLWIYFWHIVVLHYWFILKDSFGLSSKSMAGFIIVFCLSLTLTALQSYGISRLIKKTAFGQHHQQLLKTLFIY